MGGSVLCVDSDRNLCQIVAKTLSAEGYRVATAHDGARALDLVVKQSPDLVLLDVILPGRDGFQVLEAVRELPGPVGRTPVVLLSGCSPTPEYTRRAEALDAAALLTKPVPLARLVEVVAAKLGAPRPRAPARAARRRAEAPAAHAPSGRLQDFPFAALLHHLHGLRASGVLHLSHGRKRKWIQLREGYPTAVRSNLMDETLGNFLVRTGRLDERDLKESHRRMGPGRRQGEILVAMQVLSEEDVSEALRDHADAKFYDIFGWPGGDFRFELGAQLRRASGLARTSPANRILEGARTRLPLDTVDAWFEQRGDAVLVRGQEPFYRFQEIDLDPEHRRWLESLDGEPRLSEFANAGEELRRTLYGLFATGLVELRSGDGASPPPATRAARPRATRAARPPEARTPARPPRAVPRPAAPPNPVAEEAKRAELAAMAERFAGCSYFEILEVPESADDDEVRAAYERLAGKTHPDRVNAASEAVRQFAAEAYAHVERAYETLRDPRRRQEYLLDCKRQGREAAERELAQRALEAERHFQQGESELRDRAYEIALRSFGEALRLYPEDGEYHAHYGWALHMCHPDDAQMAEEAIEHVKRGIKLARDREKPYLLLGRLCKATGRVGAAEKMFTRAVQLQPNCVEALRELRLINMRRDRQKGFIGRLLRR